jgi:hypothetical protein
MRTLIEITLGWLTLCLICVGIDKGVRKLP